VLDVLNLYLTEVARGHTRPEETKQRILKLADFFEQKTLDDITGDLCRDYVDWRVGQPWKSSKPEKTNRPARTVTEASARRELEDLRAAINHHIAEGRCTRLILVVLPDKSEPRPDWLTRSEAARLIWAAWRAKQKYQHHAPNARSAGTSPASSCSGCTPAPVTPRSAVPLCIRPSVAATSIWNEACSIGERRRLWRPRSASRRSD
jgi:hypothetical protein